MDCFATANNAQCPRFFSRYHDPLSSGVDAFSHDWSGEHVWLNPPWDLLPEVVRKLRSHRRHPGPRPAPSPGVRATVVAPVWQAQPWFHDLSSLASDSVSFTPQRDLFLPGHLGNVEPLGNPHWRVRAFFIDL